MLDLGPFMNPKAQKQLYNPVYPVVQQRGSTNNMMNSILKKVK